MTHITFTVQTVVTFQNIFVIHIKGHFQVQKVLKKYFYFVEVFAWVGRQVHAVHEVVGRVDAVPGDANALSAVVTVVNFTNILRPAVVLITKINYNPDYFGALAKRE